jgi:PAS domain S-box-containing protein
MRGGDKKTILLVEDDYLIAEAERQDLGERGYEVQVAASGEEAIELCLSAPGIDVVLMDIDLGGGMDGAEAARAILGQVALPIIFLTSHADDETLAKTDTIASYGCLAKSSGMAVIGRAIRTALRLQEKLKSSEGIYPPLAENTIEAALRNEQVIRNAQVGIVVYDLDLRCSLWNPFMEKMSGIAAPAALGRRPAELLPTLGAHGATWTGPERALAGETKTRAEYEFTWSITGEPGWATDLSCPLRDAAGQLIGALVIVRDVTERRRADDGLRTSEERLRQALGAAKAGTWEWDLRTDVNAWSSEIWGLYGLSPDTVSPSYESFMECILPEDRGRIVAALEAAVGTGTGINLEWRVRGSGPEGRWLMSRGKPEFDEAGDLARYLGVVIDVTERKRAEAELRKSEANLQAILSSSAMGILAVDTRGDIMHSNSRFMDIWRVPAELRGSGRDAELLGHASLAVADPEAFRSKIDALIDSREEELDLILLKDGRMLERHSGPILLEGAIAGRLWSFQDVTVRRQAEMLLEESEKRLSHALAEAPFPIMIHAEDGEVVAISRAWTELSGYRHEDIPTTGIWAEKAYGAARAAAYEEINAIYGYKNRKNEGEYLVRRADGGERVWDFSSVGLGAGADGRRLAMSMASDVTERKSAELRIRELLSEKELILKEVHHRIKNNLNTVLSFLLLHAEEAGEESARVLRDAGSRVQSMLVLYDRLYSSGSFVSMSVKLYFPGLIEQIIANFSNADSVRLQVRTEDFELDVDRLQPLGIILNELLTNIMKYAFVGRAGGEIAVGLSLAGGRVTLSVEDDGTGLPDSVDFSHSSGFGLSLVEGLTRQLRGSIRVERSPGTRVILEFDR